jgi:CRISPR-associated protein Cmr4
VRTAARAFAWITCPLALARLARDVEQAGLPALKPVKETPDKDKAVVTPRWPKASDGVLLEEFAYEAIASATLGEASGWIADHLLPVGAAYDYWRDAVRAGVVLVADEEFRDFVRHGTEVVTRVRLAKNKTVEQGALWTEENVPADTLFYAFAAAWKPAEGVSATLKAATEVAKRIGSLFDASRVVQVGGKETVGRGFVAVRVAGGNHGQA